MDTKPASTFEKLMRELNVMRETLEACADYFDARADADMQGDPPRYVPNEEMRMLQQVREALGEGVL
jgi:hypothetical protein